jgi:hypothetical protein
MAIGIRPGYDVGRVVERGVETIRRQIDVHVAGIEDSDQKAKELVDRRGAALLDLAKHYLPDISAETVQGSFYEVRDDLAAILAQKQRRQRELQDQVAGAERETEHLEAELNRVTLQLNEKVAERERLEALVAERLHGSEEFKTLSQRALEAERELERNEDRVAEMQGEAKKKLPSYDRSRLFRYLYDAGYGTAKYKGEGFTRRMDAWVAKLIDYHNARRGYDFLRITPELMAQEVSRRRDSFNELMEQVEAIEDKVGDEVGLTDVMREGQQLGAERDRLVAAVAEQQNQLHAREQQLLKLAGVDNEFYEQAVARMKNFLANVPPHELADHSRSTPEHEDDAIVAEVTYLNEQLDDVDRRGAELAAERQAWDQRLAGLQQVLQQFRAAEFDSQRSMFPDRFDVEGLVDGYLAGRYSAQQVWTAIHEAQEFAPAWHEQQRVPGGPSIGDILTSDASVALLRVLTDIAGEAMRQSARRGVERRAPMRQQRRESAGRPPFPRNRGFTNGRGF